MSTVPRIQRRQVEAAVKTPILIAVTVTVIQVYLIQTTTANRQNLPCKALHHLQR